MTLSLKNTYKQNKRAEFGVERMRLVIRLHAWKSYGLLTKGERDGRKERDTLYSDEKNKGVHKLYLFLMPLKKKGYTYIKLKDNNNNNNNNNSIPFLLR